MTIRKQVKKRLLCSLNKKTEYQNTHQRVIRDVKKVAEENDVEQVETVTLEIGEESGVVHDLIARVKTLILCGEMSSI